MIWKDSVEVSLGDVEERLRWFEKALGKGSEGTLQGDLEWCEGIW